MAASEAFQELLRDCLDGLGPFSIRRMFGGAGLYADGVMFGLIADDVLYFKADETTCAEFQAEGMEPFTYTGKSRPVRMSYWQVPDRLFDSPEEMQSWARTALAVARRRAGTGDKVRGADRGGQGSEPQRKPRRSRQAM